MEFRFVPTAEDWRAVQKASSRSSGWMMFQFIMSFVPLFVLGVVLVQSGLSVIGWSCVGSSIAVALASYEVPRVLNARRFRSSPFVKGERLLTLDHNGITAIVPFGQTQFRWEAFTSYRETKTSFVVFTSQGQVVSWIPKRVMTAVQLDELRGLLRLKLTRL